MSVSAMIVFPVTTGACDVISDSEFVRVGDDGQFYLGDSVYRFVGTNFWYGPILASDSYAGDRDRLHRELDKLQSIGITNLRVLAGAEGPEGLPHHLYPVLQTAPGVYDESLLRGLDYFICQLEQRGMKAVIYLNNAWEWSGGYGSYLQWSGYGAAPVPGIDGYQPYVDHVSHFVLDDKARELAVRHAEKIVSRKNSITGGLYSESPAIMAWQIANEPRAFSRDGKHALYTYLRDTARAIKRIDPNHLVSTGSEGKYGCEVDLELWREIHSLPEIDYAVIHLWPTNWGWASRDSVESHVGNACRMSDEYIDEHLQALKSYKRPLVIEEFGYPRDGMALAPASPVTARDYYYSHIFCRWQDDIRIAGVNFWGWNGEARPVDRMWSPGAAFTCDPPHEPQGLYGVFDSDTTTVSLLRMHNVRKDFHLKK